MMPGRRIPTLAGAFTGECGICAHQQGTEAVPDRKAGDPIRTSPRGRAARAVVMRNRHAALGGGVRLGEARRAGLAAA